MTEDQATLKHWIKQLLRTRMDLEEVRRVQKDLPLDEFLSKTHRLTLAESRAEEVIGDMLRAEPDLEAAYKALHDEAEAELAEDRERSVEHR